MHVRPTCFAAPTFGLWLRRHSGDGHGAPSQAARSLILERLATKIAQFKKSPSCSAIGLAEPNMVVADATSELL